MKAYYVYDLKDKPTLQVVVLQSSQINPPMAWWTCIRRPFRSIPFLPFFEFDSHALCNRIGSTCEVHFRFGNLVIISVRL
jgi:hypothetical protein